MEIGKDVEEFYDLQLSIIKCINDKLESYLDIVCVFPDMFRLTLQDNGEMGLLNRLESSWRGVDFVYDVAGKDTLQLDFNNWYFSFIDEPNVAQSWFDKYWEQYNRTVSVINRAIDISCENEQVLLNIYNHLNEQEQASLKSDLKEYAEAIDLLVTAMNLLFSLEYKRF